MATRSHRYGHDRTEQQSDNRSLVWVPACMVPHSLHSMRAGTANHQHPVSQAPCHHPAAFTLGTEEGHFVSAKRLGCLEKRYVYWTFLQGVGQNQRNRTRPCFLDPVCWVASLAATRKRRLYHQTTQLRVSVDHASVDHPLDQATQLIVKRRLTGWPSMRSRASVPQK